MVLFLFGANFLFPQNESARQDTESDSSIPDELKRPRRDESPRYPIDTVIGELGKGRASSEAYEFAGKVASALLAGTSDASVLASVNKVFLESCMSTLSEVNPRLYRLGSGREEPDGAVSFLVRFAGREQGITGELFIRYEERKAPPPPPKETEQEISSEDGEEENEDETPPTVPLVPPVPTPAVPAGKIWVFEDLILEEARSRETENRESRHRYDFPPYERFF